MEKEAIALTNKQRREERREAVGSAPVERTVRPPKGSI